MLRVNQIRSRSWPTEEVAGRWIASRPFPLCFWQRAKDAWEVLWGRADAVRFWRR